MNHISDIRRGPAGGQIRSRPQIDNAARLRHRVGLQTEFFKHLLRLGIELETREYFFVADPATWILVHDINELPNRVLAVADNVARGPARGRHQLAVYDEQPMIIAFEEGLHDH